MYLRGTLHSPPIPTDQNAASSAYQGLWYCVHMSNHMPKCKHHVAVNNMQIRPVAFVVKLVFLGNKLPCHLPQLDKCIHTVSLLSLCMQKSDTPAISLA